MVILAASLLGQGARAGDRNPPLTIVAQRDLPSGKEQIAILFDATGARLTLNSNFMEHPGPLAHLGLFHAAMSPALKDLKSSLERSSEKLSKRDQGYSSLGMSPIKPGANPHETRFSVGGHEVRSEAAIRDRALDTFSKIWSLAEWAAIDSAEITQSPEGKPRVRFAGKSAESNSVTAKTEPKCRPRENGAVACAVPDFGMAYLTRH